MVTRITETSWKELGNKLYGADIKAWKFICPLCGQITSVSNFMSLGYNEMEALLKARSECIGVSQGASINDPTKQPCNWKAKGMFKTLGKGYVLIHSDKTEEDIFKFADK